MRAAAVLLLVLASLSSGCLALARTQPLGEHDAVAQPGGVWYAPLLQEGVRWRVAYEVTAAEGSLRACIVSMPDASRHFRTDPFFAGLGTSDCTPLGEGNASSATLTADIPPDEPRTLALDCLGDAPCRARVRIEGKGVTDAARGWLLLGGMVALVLALRLAADRLDRARIRRFVEARGGTVVDIAWQPFGRGWFGEKGERVYAVTFTDDAGRRQEARFKTSLWSGVWTDQLG